MATLVLSTAGQVVGDMILPGLGGVIGRAAGAIGGSVIDQALVQMLTPQAAEGGPKLDDLNVTSSTEGAPVPRLYGRARLGGQLIWATALEEVQTSGGGGKGIGAGSGSSTEATYLYYANFAIAICAGPVSRIGRIWADGKDFDISRHVARIYYGDETQAPDSLISAKQGAGNAPAYRGVAYIVFERLPLKDFGNRIPQFNFEVFRTVDVFEGMVRAVTLIPAAGEFAYETAEVMRDVNRNGSYWLSENRRGSGGVDVQVSLDALQEQLPNAGAVSLFVAWFGSDLRAGNCTLTPRVETSDKSTAPVEWAAAGLTRATAGVVSTHDGAAAYGGTPSDASVTHAIQEMHARGLEVAFTPFILMDIPAGNALPDPYQAGTPAGQAAYPWRGRITVSPAPGVGGTVDQTAAAGTQIAAFVVQYRAMILHYANLCAAAGGVEAFVIGSEMRGLTWCRSAAGTFPFVDALVALAADVAAILPAAKLVYAADWSEIAPYQTAQFGGPAGEVYFHLDALWASPHIDAVGVDNYWPLSDWRDGTDHLDYAAGWRSADDLAYLKSNIEGGEGYAWYYASQAARDAQDRTPITDGAYGKPWVYRYKDLRNWWSNAHHNRPGGVEAGTPTAWTAQSKPVWFMELGCPAVDRGANQPNVFYDPKSSESFFPYYSSGRRNDVAQRRFLRAHLEHWADPAHNPTSSVYGAPMVDASRVFLYTWDARPHPAFPALSGLWGDAPNWPTGHWLTGRMGEAPLAETVAAILADAEFADFDASELTGSMAGYVVDRIMSPRAAIEPLANVFFFDAVESGGQMVFRRRGREVSAALTPDDLVDPSTGSGQGSGGGQGADAAGLYQLARAQETELPRSAKLNFVNADNDYSRGVAEARRHRDAMKSGRESQAEIPIVWTFEAAGAAAATLLHEAWAGREKATFALPPSVLALEPGDVVSLTAGGVTRELRLAEIGFGTSLSVTAASCDAHIYGAASGAGRALTASAPAAFGPVTAAFLDLPLIRGDETPYAGYVAAFASPWSGAAFWRSPSGTGYALAANVAAASVMGETLWDFWSGPTSRWDSGNSVQVKLYGGTLASVDDVTLFSGANIAAVQNSAGEWEVFQFKTAVLAGDGVYTLSGLLRGQWGTEAAMRSPVAAGARFVLLAGAPGASAGGVVAVSMTAADVGVSFSWKFGPASADYGDWTYQTTSRAFAGLGLKPLAPCHVARTRNSGGDDVISWVRRTRVNGDNWEQAEVPLGEDSESYDVEIMDGATVRRTLTVASPSATYTAAQQTADWGGAAPSSLTVRVSQRSATYGRGWPREAAV